MSVTPPPPSPPPGPGRQPPPPPSLPSYPLQPEGRSVSFYVSLFLALLLLISGGINILVFFFSMLGTGAGGTDSVIEETEAGYRVVATGGDREASTDKILQIKVEGAIAEAASPLIGAMGGTVTDIRRQLKLAANDSIKGVLLTINSPGGGVTASDEIHRLISEFREKHNKPVLAYFGDMSASGGYYIAAACDMIVARPTTITGSIGVIMSTYNLAGAMSMLGIKEEVIISPNTPYKDIMSFSRDMRDDERKIMTDIVEEMYQRFVDVVDEGRPELSRDQVISIANGQIYSAGQALSNGLVDAIATPDQAFELLKELAGLPAAQLVEQRRLPSLMETLVGGPIIKAPELSLQDTIARYLNRTTGARLLYFWPGGR